MTETRLGRQTPTQSVTIPYSKTRGQEAAELYAKTGNELLEWQQLLQCDIRIKRRIRIQIIKRRG